MKPECFLRKKMRYRSITLAFENINYKIKIGANFITIFNSRISYNNAPK